MTTTPKTVPTMILATVLMMSTLTNSLGTSNLNTSETYLKRRHQNSDHQLIPTFDGNSLTNYVHDIQIGGVIDNGDMGEENEVTEENSEIVAQCKLVYDTGMGMVGWYIHEFSNDRDVLEDMLRWGNASLPEFEVQQQHMEQICANHRRQASRFGTGTWTVIDAMASYLGLDSTESLDTKLNGLDADIRILQQKLKTKVMRMRSDEEQEARAEAP